MSSSTRFRPDRAAVRSAVFGAAVCAVQWISAATAWSAPSTLVAVLPPADRTVQLVVDVGAFARPTSITVAVAGVRQPAVVTPVMSERLAAGLVVDASADGGPALPGWLSGAARFALDAPATARTAIIADTSRPLRVSTLRSNAPDTVRALNTVRAGGNRHTAAALALAVDQLPRTVDGPRVVVLYTTATDAGDTADNVAGRLRGAHALLVVVTTAADTTYWSRLTHDTGGFTAPATAGSVVPALDQVSTVLRSRYLVSIPTPGKLPAPVSVRVDTGPAMLTGATVVPATAVGDRSQRASAGRGGLLLPAIVGAAAMAAVFAVLVIRRRQAR
jgi:hypothetical protein